MREFGSTLALKIAAPFGNINAKPKPWKIRQASNMGKEVAKEASKAPVPKTIIPMRKALSAPHLSPKAPAKGKIVPVAILKALKIHCKALVSALKSA